MRGGAAGHSEFFDNEEPTSKFPEVELNVESLPTDFRETEIVSFGPATSMEFRTWGGIYRSRSNTHLGGLSARWPSTQKLQLPPLIQVMRDGFQRHPTSLVFGPNAIESHVVGRVELDGVKCILVHRVFSAPESGYQNGFGEFVRAWLDPVRGFMPVRIEVHYVKPDDPASEKWHTRMSQHTTPLGPPTMDSPAHIVRVEEIREVTPGLFYPTQGIEEVTGPGPVEAGRLPNVSAVHELIRWNVERVAIDPPMSDETFALRFPASTEYYDDRLQQTFVTTDAEGNVERVVLGTMSGSGQRDGLWTTVFVSLGAFVCVGLSAYYGSRWRRVRSGLA